MLRIRWILTTLMILTFVHSAWPQAFRHDYQGKGSWFIGIDGGTSLSMNENITSSNLFSTAIPSASVVLGRTLTPRWNFRLSAGFSAQKGYASKVARDFDSDLYAPYDFFCLLAEGDLMLNLVNCFRRYNTRNWFDCYLVVGGGELYRFKMTSRLKNWDDDVFPVETENKWFWLAKTGLEGAWHVSRALDVTTEVDLNATDNAYNGVVGRNRNLDWFLSMRLGVVYYFANRQHRHRFANSRKPHLYWTELN